ncbi:peptidoglycan-binding domain-containing protein [Streptomyces millisiae]|uniref:Peptidoglycan-binding domain-containing protein n=1 Tax=Streptomyces millisiae TaxID=3075542 RepID=A0ABU2LXJ6_9ACTN|nr:peptidoglycan-binding domain-containing protein [Streptomyces sp. DSM 44918]MDT0322291.1 peptidoglycan-binding domain-containing protein [Streptomyces sp. DSM 44918]
MPSPRSATAAVAIAAVVFTGLGTLNTAQAADVRPTAHYCGYDSRVTPPTIAYGSTGDTVRELWCLLVVCGYDPGAYDGVFGDGLRRAVRAFQRDHGLAVDGIVGPTTWYALRNCVPA